MFYFASPECRADVARGRRKSNSSVAESAAVPAASELATIDMQPDAAVVAVRGTNDDLILSMKQAKSFPFTPAPSPGAPIHRLPPHAGEGNFKRSAFAEWLPK